MPHASDERPARRSVRNIPAIRFTILMTALLCGSSANAQSLKWPTVVFVGGMTADIATSHLGTLRGTCVEMTRGLRWGQQHPWAQTLVTSGITVGGVYLWRFVGKTYPRVAAVGLIGSGALHGWQGWRNYQECWR